MVQLKTPLPSEGFHSFASALVRKLLAQPSCPQCDTTSVVEQALASRIGKGPAAAKTPPSNCNAEAEAEKDTQHPDAVLENGSSKHRVRGCREKDEKDETSVRNPKVPSSCDVARGEPVFEVRRKSKKGEVVFLSLSDLSPLFGLHLSNAAQHLGISPVSLKKACRHVGLHRWPGRKVRGLQSTIEGIQRSIVGQGADSDNLKAASLRSEIPKLQQELNELCHDTPAQIAEKMHSPALITKKVYSRLYSKHGWRSEHHNPGRHDVIKGDRPNLTSGLAPASAPSARENRTGANRRPSPRRIFLWSRSRLGSRDTEMKASDLEGLLPEVPDVVSVAGREVPEAQQNGNTMLTPKTEIGDEGTGDGKVAVKEEEGATAAAEGSAKRPKTES